MSQHGRDGKIIDLGANNSFVGWLESEAVFGVISQGWQLKSALAIALKSLVKS